MTSARQAAGARNSGMNKLIGSHPKRNRLAVLCLIAILSVVGWLVVGGESPAHAVDVSGTVHFEGQLFFAAPVPGIDAEDLEVSVKPTTGATESREKCSILAITSDTPDSDGTYPGLSGDVSAEMLIEAPDPQLPEGDCIVTVQASGTDGLSVSARGSQTLFVTAAEVGAGATIAVEDITVRESKAVAGLERECFKWVKKQLRKRRKCNLLLLKGGSALAERCKDAGPEPPGCDPGDHVEAILTLSHGINDQQVAPESAEGVDIPTLRDQFKCQSVFGRAAMAFAFKRLRLVHRLCVESNVDSADCRDDQSRESKPKLDKVERCTVHQSVDGATGRPVPDVGAPCDECIEINGAIDNKCLKGCLQMALDELTDGIIGDVPVCGNGILQPGEYCDDGNLINGDCCRDDCTAEHLGDQTCGLGECEVTVPVCQSGEPVTCVPDPAGIEGPAGDPTCSDTLDNDCDGDTDGDDTDCQL